MHRSRHCYLQSYSILCDVRTSVLADTSSSHKLHCMSYIVCRLREMRTLVTVEVGSCEFLSLTHQLDTATEVCGVALNPGSWWWCPAHQGPGYKAMVAIGGQYQIRVSDKLSQDYHDLFLHSVCFLPAHLLFSNPKPLLS